MPTTEVPTATEAEDATKPKRQSWKDWVPTEGLDMALADAEPFLTRAELVAALRDAGERVSERNISYWQAEGALPFPTKRKVGRGVIAIYPSWYPRLVRALRRYQREGMSLDRIGAALRTLTVQMFTVRPVPPQRQRRTERINANLTYLELRDEIVPRIRELAGIIEALDGKRVTSAEIRFSVDDEAGRSIQIPIE